MITVEIVETLDSIKQYHAQWEALFDANAYEASLSPEWSQALLNTHLGRDRFVMMLLRRSGDLVGIVPLCVRQIKKKGITLSTLFPLAEYFNTHSDLLLSNPSEELITTFLKGLFNLKWKWDIFRINRFIETSPILDLIEQNLSSSLGANYQIRRTEPSFFIDLGNSYDEYLQTRNSHFRNNLKRASKKMHARGHVEFLGIHDFHDVAEAYSIIASIEEKSWKYQHGTAITSTERQREFYKELCRRAYDKGRLRVCILNLNHNAVAYEMGVLKGRKYYSVHGSYDESFKKDNPGMVLLARCIEDLIRDGIQEFDYFGEPFDWETRWTDKARWHKSLLIYGNTPKARLVAMFNTFKDKVGHNESGQIVVHNPRDVKPSNIISLVQE